MAETSNGRNHADPISVGLALKVYDRLASNLGITMAQRSALLDQSELEYQVWLCQEGPRISTDQQDRLGHFLTIVELAEAQVGDAKAWLFAPNSSDIFRGSSPIVHLLQEGLSGFISTSNYLKGTFGGWA